MSQFPGATVEIAPPLVCRCPVVFPDPRLHGDVHAAAISTKKKPKAFPPKSCVNLADVCLPTFGAAACYWNHRRHHRRPCDGRHHGQPAPETCRCAGGPPPAPTSTAFFQSRGHPSPRVQGGGGIIAMNIYLDKNVCPDLFYSIQFFFLTKHTHFPHVFSEGLRRQFFSWRLRCIQNMSPTYFKEKLSSFPHNIFPPLHIFNRDIFSSCLPEGGQLNSGSTAFKFHPKPHLRP